MSDGEINVDSIDGEVLTTANIVGQLYPQGEKGDKGDRGDDGFSPTVETSKVGKTTTIKITDAQGEHTATILDGADGQGSGDMRTEVYDINHNGIVDDAEKVNGHTVGTDVPADAKFTDTTYTAGTGIDITNGVITNTQTSAEWGNITGTLSDQADLQNALDDKADASDIPTKVSDLTNDSGFIDKDVNNLTNYDTSTAVDTKISNSEEVLIGSDSGIKESHEIWIDPNDVTPIVNSEISNSYGTAQNLGYSQEYVNTKLAEKLDATGTAVNSTKWNNLINDKATENNADTWIPVFKDDKIQHTTISSLVSRGNEATTTQKGLMSSSDKTKLNSITNNYNTSTNVVQFNIGDIKVVVGEVSYTTGSTAPYSTSWSFTSPISFTFGYVFCQPSSGNTNRQIQIRPNGSHFSGTVFNGIATSDIANYANSFTIMIIGV